MARMQMSALIFALAAAAAAQTTPPPAAAPAPPAPVGPDAVWTPPDGFLAAMHKACDKRSGDAFGACFVARMEKAGASPAAVAFAHRTGNLGYLRQFRSTGIVAIACATYPFRANENGVCFLVNGEPPMLDVDDPKWIDTAVLMQNRDYAAIAKAYPKVAIFPGRRFGDTAAMPAQLHNGGQRFRVDYSLQDGCHACAHLGTMRMDFDFDADGKFAGTKVDAVRPLRLH